MESKSTHWSTYILQTLISAIISAGIIGTFVDYRLDGIKFTRDWKERSLSTVVGPVVMHLNRTKKVAERYRNNPVSFFDAKIMKHSNVAVRDILVTNGHLIPENLREVSHRLIEHYDVWIRRFDKKVAKENPNHNSDFDVGIANPGYPEEADRKFNDALKQLQQELYDI